jgi:hypothetical protein
MDKRDQLLLRVFKMIARNYFQDHKMLPWFCERIEFDRSLARDIANHMQNINPEYYHKKRKEYTIDYRRPD